MSFKWDGNLIYSPGCSVKMKAITNTFDFCIFCELLWLFISLGNTRFMSPFKTIYSLHLILDLQRWAWLHLEISKSNEGGYVELTLTFFVLSFLNKTSLLPPFLTKCVCPQGILLPVCLKVYILAPELIVLHNFMILLYKPIIRVGPIKKGRYLSMVSVISPKTLRHVACHNPIFAWHMLSQSFAWLFVFSSPWDRRSLQQQKTQEQFFTCAVSLW